MRSSTFYLRLPSELSSLVPILQAKFSSDNMDTGSNWFCDVDANEVILLLERNKIPFTMEIDPEEDIEDGMTIVRYYAPDHPNNTTFTMRDAYCNLEHILQHPEDADYYATLQRTHNPPVLPEDMQVTKEQFAAMVSLRLK